jgi:hypothetical protein
VATVGVGVKGMGVGAAVELGKVVAESVVWQAAITTVDSKLRIMVTAFSYMAKFYVG